MKRRAVILFLLCAFTAYGDGERGLLKSRNPNRTTPLWVPLSAAKTAEGRLAEEYFDVHARRRFQKHRERVRSNDRTPSHPSQRKCFGERPAEIPAAAETIEQLRSNSRAILSGRIIERTLGFFEDQPAAVLTVRVDRVLRSDAAFPSERDEWLLYYPDASFTIDGIEYCSQPATHAARPRAGDRVLVFAMLPPVDSSARMLYTQSSKHLVFETGDGNLLAPSQIRQEIAAEGITSFDALVQRVESSTATHGERK